MTETTCPICHSMVEAHMSDWNFSYKPLPTPDPTKLREVLEKYAPDTNNPDCPILSLPWSMAYRQFYQAVKELLGAIKHACSDYESNAVICDLCLEVGKAYCRCKHD